MKIDRLLGITIYLLNHDKVTAGVLAQRYEVSIRTIQRDINTLCMAGIPITTTVGVDGGYRILDTFKMERQLAGQNDYTFIITALRGLISAYENPQIEETLQKIEAVATAKGEYTNIILDFSVLKEKQTINKNLEILEKAILDNKTVSFVYTNATNKIAEHEVEPVAVIYKWYNWYLLGYEAIKEDYRLYKLVRMEQLSGTECVQTKKHDNIEKILKAKEQSDRRQYITIKLKCNHHAKMKVIEYMNGSIQEELADGTYLMCLHVPSGEHFWFATLLALGNDVEVIEPIELKQRLCNTCADILKLYQQL
ncbi:MAG: helix-turn-helix transcriptional regulator [Cellulosilyticaceae bacterium]